jgi:hypothetical protein
MQKRMVEALEALPGVESVGFADGLPMGDGGGSPMYSTTTPPI